MPVLIDGRELEPPEPLERTLAALEQLPEGEEVVLLLYCRPGPLFSILRQDGRYAWQESVLEDGTQQIRIQRLTDRTRAGAAGPGS
jgi:uncharacterized protein (DUF2249 family)